MTACRSSGGNGSSFDTSNVCYLSLVSFRFCCIVSVQTPYSFSMLCSTLVVFLSSFLSEWILLFTVSESEKSETESSASVLKKDPKHIRD